MPKYGRKADGSWWPRGGVLDDMAAHGVEALDCVSADNALVRPGDPLFAGLCWQQKADCGALPVWLTLGICFAG